MRNFFLSAVVFSILMSFVFAEKTKENSPAPVLPVNFLEVDVSPFSVVAPSPAVSFLGPLLIMVGEGGSSGSLFLRSAETYQKEHGGEIREVASGREFVSTVEDFVSKNGKIRHLEYFGHGNNVALFVNQVPGVNGALYANDPAQNEGFIAGSIYDLSADIFVEGGTMAFNGCNIAKGYPEKDSLAQRMANYFNVSVKAPIGPTQFSSRGDGVDRNFSLSSAKDVYMVPTYLDQGFITVSPQPPGMSRFLDVRAGQSYDEAVFALTERGLDLGYADRKFLPYKNITYREAVQFCRVAFGENASCSVSGYSDDEVFRNLRALQMLADSAGVSVARTTLWFQGYIWWASQNDLLTEGFTNKVWYTRGEMAELTWNVVKRVEVP
ncbi:S-layer homology domain-containing protein [Candidatus Peregrinibacteria bacterium]|nr:S-layer homology domain-containing protein [Candidatus Peregrinibacteria bacterium]